MASPGSCLGICFADHQLFYAVNEPETADQVLHIGSIDFNFPVLPAFAEPHGAPFSGLKSSITRLRESFPCESIRLLTPAIYECWSACPRLTYEATDEREDHIAILMDGLPREEIEATWHPLSNTDYRLLMLRNRRLTDNYRALSLDFSETDFVSEFELGTEWQQHTDINGSYLTIHCHTDHLAISSFLLGKLRGATFIRFESPDDLPYLWNWHATQLSWMNGIHEQVYIYGQYGLEISELLGSHFEATGDVILMNTLDSMKVSADEATYGFKLESAFPAVILSLNLSDRERSLAV